MLIMTELNGAVVIVTGAGRGIGRAHARALAAHGARVVVNDVAGAQACVERLAADGLTAWADPSDIGTWDGARSLIGATVNRFGCLDGLVNNAGVLRRADVADLVEEDLDLELGVNLKGAFACTRFASRRCVMSRSTAVYTLRPATRVCEMEASNGNSWPSARSP